MNELFWTASTFLASKAEEHQVCLKANQTKFFGAICILELATKNVICQSEANVPDPRKKSQIRILEDITQLSDRLTAD